MGPADMSKALSVDLPTTRDVDALIHGHPEEPRHASLMTARAVQSCVSNPG
jgi:hypothetical protein